MPVKVLSSVRGLSIFSVSVRKKDGVHTCRLLLSVIAALFLVHLSYSQQKHTWLAQAEFLGAHLNPATASVLPRSRVTMVVSATLPDGMVNHRYSGSISVQGGVAPYSFSVTRGILPRKIALNTRTGAISGTPDWPMTRAFSITVTDSTGSSTKLRASIKIHGKAHPSNISLAISPTSLSTGSGGTQQFTATVQGTSNTAVNWSTSLGSISSSGFFSAPNVTTNTSVTVNAQSAADPTQIASASVTVLPPATAISVSVSPRSTSMASGGVQQFTASVQGTTNTAVTWACSAGTISSSGLFSAPTVSTNSTVTVTATSNADPTQRATASVSVAAAAGISVSVSPGSVTLSGGDTQQFTTVVQGTTNTAVTWSSTSGTISSNGLFTAPEATSTTTVTVTATSVADTSQHASASVTVPGSGNISGTVGCGVTTGGAAALDQSTCGNHPGAPYEDLNTASPTTPPTPVGSGTIHNITSCTTIVPTAAGDVWRFGADVSDGVGGTNQKCIYFAGQNANNFVIDLAGHTLTGGIKCDQTLAGNDCSGITIVNGTVNCNIATGGSVSCITLTQGANPSNSILLSHLTVNNFNSPTSPDGTFKGFQYAMLIQASGTSSMGPVPPGAAQKTFNGAGIEEAHLTVTAAAGYTGAGYTGQWCARCTAIFNGGNAGVTVEAWDNLIPNNAYVDANQGIVFYHTGPASAHNNYFPWVHYNGTGDTGRPILFDAAGKSFNQAGGQAFNNLIEAYNNRCVRTRQVNNVLVHDNRFEHVESTIVDPCIMMGGNGDYSEKIDGNAVSNNTFTHAGGTSIEAAESYGLVADGNTFLCESNCSSGRLAAAWIAEGSNGLTFKINSASRTSACVVTLNLAYSPTTTSVLAGKVYVNVSGRPDSFNVSGTAGNLVTSISGATVTYTQAGCSGASTGGSGGIFWMAQSKLDNFPANGAQIYVKNSVVDPQLTIGAPFIACGTASPACQNPPQFTQIQWCNNTQDTTVVPASGGTGAVVTHVTPDSMCP